MRKFSILLVPLMLALLPGCAAKITNLTPSTLPRSSTGFYPMEAALTSQEQALKWETIEAAVLIGELSYPMQRTPLIPNRWEAMVPIAPETQSVRYQYEFNFYRAGMGGRQADTANSGEYELRIVEPRPIAP